MHLFLYKKTALEIERFFMFDLYLADCYVCIFIDIPEIVIRHWSVGYPDISPHGYNLTSVICTVHNDMLDVFILGKITLKPW